MGNDDAGAPGDLGFDGTFRDSQVEEGGGQGGRGGRGGDAGGGRGGALGGAAKWQNPFTNGGGDDGGGDNGGGGGATRTEVGARAPNPFGPRSGAPATATAKAAPSPRPTKLVVEMTSVGDGGADGGQVRVSYELQ